MSIQVAGLFCVTLVLSLLCTICRTTWQQHTPYLSRLHWIYLSTYFTFAPLSLWWNSKSVETSVQRLTDNTFNWQYQNGEAHKTWLREDECFWCHWKSLCTCAHKQSVWSLCTLNEYCGRPLCHFNHSSARSDVPENHSIKFCPFELPIASAQVTKISHQSETCNVVLQQLVF